MASAEIRIVYTPLSTLLRAPRNPKQHDLAALRQSLARWGFTQPLAIDERTGALVEGHGRLDVLQALQREGAPPPARVKSKGNEWLVPVVRGLAFTSDQEAEAYLLAANQLTIAGGWDEGLLAETIASLQASSTTLEGLGFDQSQLDALASSFAPAVADAVAALPPPPLDPPAAPSAPATTPSAGALTAATTPATAVTPATGAHPAPAASVLAESDIESSDGQYVPPPTTSDAGVDHLQADGVLDPTNHIPNEHPRRMVRLLTWGKYNIPVTPEEGAKFEAAIAAWLEQNGSLYGFLTSMLD
ncbi:MAG: hypothetical protein EI684_13700 [Candidatus Viridilinea halotolerans]|uniref:ParB/Sulfiredoxin domain-containing protein n=1 Tax=Candidatus Viridilinea halotolerans TaxID=2491704 RepID=A0A426TX82_9CHLR|nr:MAG: hypothetical protein EI684_13700 [Candidatus Viridilinea halotolerans]